MSISRETDAIVVGVDGSPDADRAVEWAVRLAEREHRPVTLLHAGDGRQEAAVLDKALEAARCLAPGVQVCALRVPDGPRQALITASETASMVVIGARGTGPLSRLRLGSVSHALTRHAGCPLVVTRSAGADRSPTVLVGTDLGPCSHQVVEFAFRMAEDRAWPLTVLHCFWDQSTTSGDLTADASAGLPERLMLDEEVRVHAERHPDVEVRTVLSRGFADRRLLAATLDTGLVVIGHRDLPWLDALVYGYVSTVFVEHAVGDVAVVPATTPQAVWS